MSKTYLRKNCATMLIATVVATAAALLTSMAQAADIGGFPGGSQAEPGRPPLTEGEPSPGKFVRQQSPEFLGSGVYHGLYLPTNWQPGHSYPVIVEYAPNRWEALLHARIAHEEALLVSPAAGLPRCNVNCLASLGCKEITNQRLARIYSPRGVPGFLAVLYNEPEPKVASLANGKMVKLTLPDQSHWILLSKEAVTARDGALKLTGTAAVVKRWRDGRTLVTLLAAGQAECGDVKLNADAPISRESRMP